MKQRQLCRRDELHHQEVDAVGGVHFVNGDHAGMIQGAGRTSFPEEAFTLEAVAALTRPDDFDRDRTIEMGIGGAKDDAHAAGANALLESVMRARAADCQLRRRTGRVV